MENLDTAQIIDPNLDNWFEQNEDGHNKFHMNNVDGTALPKTLAFTDATAATSKWTSEASYTWIQNGTMVLVKGSFISTAAGNTDALWTFPVGAKGTFEKVVSAKISGTPTPSIVAADGTSLRLNATVGIGDVVNVEFVYPVTD